MKELRIKQKVGKLDVDVLLDQPVNIFCGDSGTGKTYLFNLIWLLTHACMTDVKCAMTDYRSMDMVTAEKIAAGLFRDADVIILDNADLYLTKELLAELIKLDKMLIISIKDHRAEIDEPFSCFRRVEFTETSITVR